jgi:hypothetical protein
VAARALARLMQGGLVERDEQGLRFNTGVLRAAVRAAADSKVGPVDTEADRTAGATRPFLKEGRLVSIPAGHAKRLDVFDLIAQDFEIGVRYPEKQVNEILHRRYPDYAALRRYLVEDGFLEREGGGGDYWRAGGSVDLEP